MSDKIGLSRRDMLRLGVTASMVSMMGGHGKAFADALDSENKIVPHATHFGPLRAEVENGRIVDIHKSEALPKMTDMLDNIAEYVHSPNRIKYPCVAMKNLSESAGTKL
jgi:trimethylamine-N-oxide reductase (cytochrome c)